MTRSERTYYWMAGLYNLSWAALGGVYPLFLLSRGLDLFQINAILAVYFIANFLFEVPTGAVADIFGRKISFLASCVVRAFAFALYFYAETFSGFVVAEIIDAMGTTLASGSLDAWAVDGMKEDGDDSSADRLFSRGKMVSHGAMIVSGLIGGYVAEVDIAYPWLVGVGGFSVTFAVAAVTMREVRPVSFHVDGLSLVARLNPVPALRRQIAGGLRTVAGHATLRFLCMMTALIAFAVMPFMQVWPAHLTALSGAGTSLMGWVWASINIAALIGSGLLPRLLLRLDRRSALIAVTLLRFAGVTLAAASGGFGRAVAGLLAQYVGMGASDPLLGAWVNAHASREQRATVLSIQAMSFMAGGSTGLVLLGLVARAHGVPATWACCAFVFLVAAGLAWRSGNGRSATGPVTPAPGLAGP